MYAHVGGTQPLELLDDGAGLGGAASPDSGGRAAPSASSPTCRRSSGHGHSRRTKSCRGHGRVVLCLTLHIAPELRGDGSRRTHH